MTPLRDVLNPDVFEQLAMSCITDWEPWADWALRDEPFGELVRVIGVGLFEPSPRRHNQNQE